MHVCMHGLRSEAITFYGKKKRSSSSPYSLLSHAPKSDRSPYAWVEGVSSIPAAASPCLKDEIREATTIAFRPSDGFVQPLFRFSEVGPSREKNGVRATRKFRHRARETRLSSLFRTVVVLVTRTLKPLHVVCRRERGLSVFGSRFKEIPSKRPGRYANSPGNRAIGENAYSRFVRSFRVARRYN